MTGSINKAIIVGRLIQDCEIRFTNDGTKIANLNVATSEKWKDRQTGQRKVKSEFHRVVIFNERLADVAEKYLRKGSTVYLEGALQTRKWTDNSGVEKYTTEIVLQKFRGELTMLGGRSESQGSQGSYADHGGGGDTGTKWNSGGSDVHGGDLDSEIPFN